MTADAVELARQIREADDTGGRDAVALLSLDDSDAVLLARALLGEDEALKARLRRAFEGTSFGAWWAVGEAAASACMWPSVQADLQLRLLVGLLADAAYALSYAFGEDRHDPRAALASSSPEASQ